MRNLPRHSSCIFDPCSQCRCIKDKECRENKKKCTRKKVIWKDSIRLKLPKMKERCSNEENEHYHHNWRNLKRMKGIQWWWKKCRHALLSALHSALNRSFFSSSCLVSHIGYCFSGFFEKRLLYLYRDESLYSDLSINWESFVTLLLFYYYYYFLAKK